MDFECQCLYIVAKQFDDLLESLQPSQILRLFLVYYSLDVVLLLATGILPEKEPVHFHFMHTVKAAEPESIRQPAQRRRKKRQRPDFDAPVFRLSALARVIRTQAAKKKGRKIDVDPAFPPEIRGVSDADLASTSAESPPARRPCVHQFKKVG